MWNKNNTDRNGENKQNTHKHTNYSEKDNTGKGYIVSMKIKWYPPFFKATPSILPFPPVLWGKCLHKGGEGVGMGGPDML